MTMSVEEILRWLKERAARAAAEVAAVSVGIHPTNDDFGFGTELFFYWAARDQGFAPRDVAESQSDRVHGDGERFLVVMGFLEELAAVHPTIAVNYGGRAGMGLYLKIKDLCELLAKSEEKSLGGEFLGASRLYVGGPSKVIDDDSIALTRGSRKTLLLALHGLCKAAGIDTQVSGERGKTGTSPSKALERLLREKDILISHKTIEKWFDDIPEALKSRRIE